MPIIMRNEILSVSPTSVGNRPFPQNLVGSGQAAKITIFDAEVAPTITSADATAGTVSFSLPQGDSRVVTGPAWITATSVVRLAVEELPPRESEQS
jgi:hypothetical protein